MTQNVNIAVKTESGQVKKISHGVIFQPETQFKGGSGKRTRSNPVIQRR